MKDPAGLDSPPDSPHDLFASWYAAAHAAPSIRYAAAVHLATVDADGRPDGRIVLLEHFDADGFVFTTDARSPKVHQLESRPPAALTFYWEALERQVRIRGAVAPAGGCFADAAHQGRPRRSRLTPWASRQSAAHSRREELEARYRAAEERFADRESVPRPAHWRAWRLRAQSLEFWRARAARLHDRLLYEWREGAWRRTRLDP